MQIETSHRQTECRVQTAECRVQADTEDRVQSRQSTEQYGEVQRLQRSYKGTGTEYRAHKVCDRVLYSVPSSLRPSVTPGRVPRC